MERTIEKQLSEQERQRRNNARYNQAQGAQSFLQQGLEFATRVFQSRGMHHPGLSNNEQSVVCFSAARERHPKRAWVGPGRHNQDRRMRIIGQSISDRNS